MQAPCSVPGPWPRTPQPSAATGRLPLGDAWALHARLGLSFGQVSGTAVLPTANTLMGNQRSLLSGVGVEYKPRPNLALTVNVDRYGKLSNSVRASSLVLGAHIWF